MGYLAVWKVLEQLLTDMKGRGMIVPESIVHDLRNARTIINLIKVNPGYAEDTQKLEDCLTRAESYLVNEGQNRFGQPYIDEWLQRTQKARIEVDEEEKKTSFITSTPRRQKFIRLKPSKELTNQELKILAEESRLSHKTQTDGSFVIFGSDMDLKDFVKKIAAKHRPNTTKKRSKST